MESKIWNVDFSENHKLSFSWVPSETQFMAQTINWVPVAKVISTNKKNDKAFQDIVVEILSDLHNYNYIFVVL